MWCDKVTMDCFARHCLSGQRDIWEISSSNRKLIFILLKVLLCIFPRLSCFVYVSSSLFLNVVLSTRASQSTPVSMLVFEWNLMSDWLCVIMLLVLQTVPDALYCFLVSLFWPGSLQQELTGSSYLLCWKENKQRDVQMEEVLLSACRLQLGACHSEV